MYIDSSKGLERFVARSAATSVLAIDTEFIREKTYYPKLCLLQVATDKDCVIIDPLAIPSLEPLGALFDDERIVKVFHAAAQDLEIIFNIFGHLPRPIFDTQQAAELYGYHQLGLAALVQRICGVHLDKGNSFTDWQQRPLSKSQIEYALNDVRYLPRIYTKMRDELQRAGRLEWLQEEQEALLDEAVYRTKPEDCWIRVKHVSRLKPQQLSIARELAAWRERTAQKKDFPRKWVLTDEQIIEIARREPLTVEDMYTVRGLESKLGAAWGNEVFKACQRGEEAEPTQWPKPPERSVVHAAHTSTVDMLTALLHARAHEHRIAASVLAKHKDLVHLVNGQREGLPVLTGWRANIVGNDLIRLLDGKLSLALDHGNLKVTALSQPGE